MSHGEPLTVDIKRNTGAGDSMVAGFVMQIEKGMNETDHFCHAVSAPQVPFCIRDTAL